MKQLELKNLTICGDPTDTTGVLCVGLSKNESGVTEILFNEAEWYEISEYVAEYYMKVAQHNAPPEKKTRKKRGA